MTIAPSAPRILAAIQCFEFWCHLACIGHNSLCDTMMKASLQIYSPAAIFKSTLRLLFWRGMIKKNLQVFVAAGKDNVLLLQWTLPTNSAATIVALPHLPTSSAASYSPSSVVSGANSARSSLLHHLFLVFLCYLSTVVARLTQMTCANLYHLLMQVCIITKSFWPGVITGSPIKTLNLAVI